MPDHLSEQLGYTPNRIAVFRALQLGDVLVAAPFFRALRRQFPAARIAFIGLPWAREIVRRFSCYLDEFFEFPGHPGLPERAVRPGDFPDFCRRTRRERWDVAIQLHGDGRISNQIVRALGARIVCGFYPAGSHCPDRELFTLYPPGNEIVRNLKLLEFLRLPTAGTHLEFALEQKDWEEFENLRRRFRLADAYVCLHAGARYESRRWPAERFAELGDRLSADGFSMVLTGGKNEAALVDDVSRRMSRTHIKLAGKTSLGGLAALLRRARLVITNDTGVSHVASAVGAPSIVIVLGSDPARWAPLNKSLHVVVCQPIDCRPCAHFVCPIGHPCATAVSVERVLAAARDQLRSKSPSCAPEPDFPDRTARAQDPWKDSFAAASFSSSNLGDST